MKFRRLTRAEWSQHVEAATLASRSTHLANATAAFRKLPSVGAKMSLAVEIAETRASELCLAYKNVVMVAAGYRRRRDRKGIPRTVKEPCVTFIVRQKWKQKGSEKAIAQRLPSHLLACTTVDGARITCAVPTDVVSETEFFPSRPQVLAEITAESAEAYGEGAITCGVYIRSGNSAPRAAALSCQHVFTPVRHLGQPAPMPDSRVYLTDGQAPIGRTTPWGGQLRHDGAPSQDVQLTTAEDKEALGSALDGLRLSPAKPFVSSLAELLTLIEAPFAILRPGQLALRAKFSHHLPGPQGIPYPFMAPSGLVEYPVNHRLLILFDVTNGSTEEGDSGSPIVTRAPDGAHCLAGMHIAGHGTSSYAIPAWMLFNPAQYSHLPPGAALRPITDPI